MLNSKDKGGRDKNLDRDMPYAVGNKKPPLQFQFKPGQSGNPRGRPKGRGKDLTNLVMKEFYKPVVVNIGGKTVKKSRAEIFAELMVKNAITKGGAATKLVLKVIEEHEAREDRREELKAKKEAEGSIEIDWDEEREQLRQRLMAATADTGQASAPTNE